MEGVGQLYSIIDNFHCVMVATEKKITKQVNVLQYC